MTNFVRSQAFDVFRPDYDRWNLPNHDKISRVDTVFYQERARMTTEEVRRELIEHDGYPHDIIVRKAK